MIQYLKTIQKTMVLSASNHVIDNTSFKLKKDEVIDDLQRDGLKIIQNKKFFKFGIDAVLLTFFCNPRKAETIVDLGTGSGVVALLLSAKYQTAQINGLEIQPAVADMAQRSVLLNQLQSRVSIINGDIKNWQRYIKAQSADVVTANPPYFKSGSGLANPNDYKLISRHEVACTLDDLFSAANGILKPNGQFYLIHRPNRLVDIFETARKYRLEPKVIQLVKPRIDEAANLALIKCVKYGGAELKWLPPIVVYDEAQKYTEQIYHIYNQAHLTAFSEEN